MGGNISKSHSLKTNYSNIKRDDITTNGRNTRSQSSISGLKKKTSTRVVVLHDSRDLEFYLEESKRANMLMVIDFSAAWCGPCRFVEPKINDFAKMFTQVLFLKIDVDELHDLASEFGIQVMPTFVLIRNGKEVEKLEGANPDELEHLIQKHRF